MKNVIEKISELRRDIKTIGYKFPLLPLRLESVLDIITVSFLLL